MERRELVEARIFAGFSQEEVAAQIGVTRNTISQWERGKTNPYPIHVQSLCKLFGKSARELGLNTRSQKRVDMQKQAVEIPQNALETGMRLDLLAQETLQEREIKDREKETMDVTRRHLLLQLSGAAGPLLLSPAVTVATREPSSPTVAIEEFTLQCAGSLKACWHLLKGSGLTLTEEILATYVPSLTTLIQHPSCHVEMLAGLAAQAKILQAVLAMHRLNFLGREMYCHEAVKYGEISGDTRLHAAALMYLAYTYTYCTPQQPKKAITFFLNGLQVLGDEPSSLKSDIYIGLADAYAQCRQEQEAFQAIGLAQKHFPDYPELDPSALYADYGPSEIYQWEGKMYLDLARQYPGRGYSQKAYASFSQSLALQSIAERSATETIIHLADAARGTGDLDRYVALLTEGTHRARSLGSQKRYSEAFDIFRRTPAQWKNEQQIRHLAENIFWQPPGKVMH
ncbi:MAG TPA: helix-turn-helix domain-containing protein [Ktedonobacteraceae bacterium]|jgi:transcriptional regulator with XRE-family HTH domain|nr:helix-turn-helix domain-containing protein [Ktedonobacteraceae bacterium]